MFSVEYKQREYIDKFKCIDTIRKINCISFFQSMNLLYCRLNQFNFKVIEVENIISIMEV